LNDGALTTGSTAGATVLVVNVNFTMVFHDIVQRRNLTRNVETILALQLTITIHELLGTCAWSLDDV
jgi:hypothetical protein